MNVLAHKFVYIILITNKSFKIETMVLAFVSAVLILLSLLMWKLTKKTETDYGRQTKSKPHV